LTEVIIGATVVGGIVIVLIRVLKVRNWKADASYGYFVPSSGRDTWTNGCASMDEAVGDAEAAIDNWTEVD
jgi:hypothetical protein